MAMIGGTSTMIGEDDWETLFKQQRTVIDVEGTNMTDHFGKQRAVIDVKRTTKKGHLDKFDASIDSEVFAELHRRNIFDDDLREKITLSNARISKAQSGIADAEEIIQIVLGFETKARQHHQIFEECCTAFDQYVKAQDKLQSNQLMQIHRTRFTETDRTSVAAEVDRLGLEKKKWCTRMGGMCAAIDVLKSMIQWWGSQTDILQKDLCTAIEALRLVHGQHKTAAKEIARFLNQSPMSKQTDILLNGDTEV